MDSKCDIRKLKLRMGWTSADLARRLGVHVNEIEIWEQGSTPTDLNILNQIEFLFRQADVCREEVRSAPLAEDRLERESLEQLDLADVEMTTFQDRQS